MTKRLQWLYLLSIPLFIAHGLEEYFTGIYVVDSQVQFALAFLKPLGSLQTRFLIYQIVLWALLVTAYLLVRKGILQTLLSVLLGLILIYELQHFYGAFITGGYYPGLVTAFLFPVIGFFLWKELFKQRVLVTG